jgi:hypothetical protein
MCWWSHFYFCQQLGIVILYRFRFSLSSGEDTQNKYINGIWTFRVLLWHSCYSARSGPVPPPTPPACVFSIPETGSVTLQNLASVSGHATKTCTDTKRIRSRLESGGCGGCGGSNREGWRPSCGTPPWSWSELAAREAMRWGAGAMDGLRGVE